MNKAQMVTEMARRLGTTEVATEKFVNAYHQTIMEVVASGERLTLANFLTFGIKYRKPVMRRNPSTDEPIQVPAGWRITVRVGKGFKDHVSTKAEEIA